MFRSDKRQYLGAPNRGWVCTPSVGLSSYVPAVGLCINICILSFLGRCVILVRGILVFSTFCLHFLQKKVNYTSCGTFSGLSRVQNIKVSRTDGFKPRHGQSVASDVLLYDSAWASAAHAGYCRRHSSSVGIQYSSVFGTKRWHHSWYQRCWFLLYENWFLRSR